MKNEEPRIGFSRAGRRVNVWLGWLFLSAPFSLLLLAGCDSVFTAAAQGSEASLRTLIDILLTDFTNQVADTLTGEGESQAGDGDGQVGDGDADDSEPDGGEDETTEPDDSGDGSAAGGETLFAENNCGACHCADAGGGCALDAPALAGTTLETLTDRLTGIEPHAGGQVELSDGDFADLQAYLASL